MRRQTLHEWLKRGEQGGSSNARYAAFAQAVEQAKAEAEVDLVAQMRLASRAGSWKATAWLLEHLAPERWGRAAQASAEEPVESDPFGEVDQLAERRAARAQ